jgi:hypothetical protein
MRRLWPLHSFVSSYRRIDRELQRRIVIGLEGRIFEAQRSSLGVVQPFLAGRGAADAGPFKMTVIRP